MKTMTNNDTDTNKTNYHHGNNKRQACQNDKKTNKTCTEEIQKSKNQW